MAPRGSDLAHVARALAQLTSAVPVAGSIVSPFISTAADIVQKADNVKTNKDDLLQLATRAGSLAILIESRIRECDDTLADDLRLRLDLILNHLYTIQSLFEKHMSNSKIKGLFNATKRTDEIRMATTKLEQYCSDFMIASSITTSEMVVKIHRLQISQSEQREQIVVANISNPPESQQPPTELEAICIENEIPRIARGNIVLNHHLSAVTYQTSTGSESSVQVYKATRLPEGAACIVKTLGGGQEREEVDKEFLQRIKRGLQVWSPSILQLAGISKSSSSQLFEVYHLPNAETALPFMTVLSHLWQSDMTKAVYLMTRMPAFIRGWYHLQGMYGPVVSTTKDLQTLYNEWLSQIIVTGSDHDISLVYAGEISPTRADTLEMYYWTPMFRKAFEDQAPKDCKLLLGLERAIGGFELWRHPEAESITEGLRNIAMMAGSNQKLLIRRLAEGGWLRNQSNIEDERLPTGPVLLGDIFYQDEDERTVILRNAHNQITRTVDVTQYFIVETEFRSHLLEVGGVTLFKIPLQRGRGAIPLGWDCWYQPRDRVVNFLSSICRADSAIHSACDMRKIRLVQFLKEYATLYYHLEALEPNDGDFEREECVASLWVHSRARHIRPTFHVSLSGAQSRGPFESYARGSCSNGTCRLTWIVHYDKPSQHDPLRHSGLPSSDSWCRQHWWNTFSQYQSRREFLRLVSLPEDQLDETEEEIVEIATPAVSQESPSVHDFWTIVLCHCCEVEPSDFKLLSTLTDIQVIPHAKEWDYSIRFIFSQNDYFTNSELNKHFHLLESDNGVRRVHLLADQIQWKAGQPLSDSTTLVFPPESTMSGPQRPCATSKSFFNEFDHEVSCNDCNGIETEMLEEIAQEKYLIGTMFRKVVEAIKRQFNGSSFNAMFSSSSAMEIFLQDIISELNFSNGAHAKKLGWSTAGRWLPFVD